MSDPDDLTIHAGRVLPEWIDANGHMNVAWYGLVFDQAVDALWARIGHDDDYRRQHASTTFAVESHTRYLQELREGERFAVSARIVGVDAKRVHQWQMLRALDDGRLAATCEWLHLHVSLTTRRVSPWPDTIVGELAALHSAQRHLPGPDGVSAAISLQRRKS